MKNLVASSYLTAVPSVNILKSSPSMSLQKVHQTAAVALNFWLSAAFTCTADNTWGTTPGACQAYTRYLRLRASARVIN